MSGSEVCSCSFTSKPPASPTLSPASLASWSVGRTPMERITISALSTLPLSSPTVLDPISTTLAPVLMPTPYDSISFSIKPAVSASIIAITCGIISTTFTVKPRLTRASTISSPMNPPPTTTAVWGLWSSRKLEILSISSSVHKVKTWSWSAPGSSGLIGRPPCAKMSLVYSKVLCSPLRLSTVLTTWASLSMVATSVCVCTSTLYCSLKLSGLWRISFERLLISPLM